MVHLYWHDFPRDDESQNGIYWKLDTWQFVVVCINAAIGAQYTMWNQKCIKMNLFLVFPSHNAHTSIDFRFLRYLSWYIVCVITVSTAVNHSQHKIPFRYVSHAIFNVIYLHLNCQLDGVRSHVARMAYCWKHVVFNE